MGRFRFKAKEIEVDFHVPPPVVRMLIVGSLATLVISGIIYARGERPDVSLGPKGASISQPKGIESKEAEVRSKDVPSDRILIPPAVADSPQNQAPERKMTRTNTGYYLERLRVQGDGEGEFVFVRRACVPPKMPEVCYLPQEQRLNRPIDRE